MPVGARTLVMGTHNTVDSDERLFDIVETLKQRGYVVQDDQQRYRPGLRFLDVRRTA